VTQSHRSVVAKALQRPRYEVMPVRGTQEQIARHVPREVTITVTVSPRWGIDRTLDFAEPLLREGFEVVPHLSARLVRDRAHLHDILQRLKEMGVRDLFVVAGDVERPAGEFAGADALLPVMAELGHGLDQIGITGYPESHPFMREHATIQAMHDKGRFATYIVSQMCFRPNVVGAWVQRVRRLGVHLPIFVGMPGNVSPQRLLRFAARIGVGQPLRFLSLHRRWVVRLLAPWAYRADRFIRGLAPYMADPSLSIAGVHVYTFNEVVVTENWRQVTLRRLSR
jgi:methylenetetrahydrofolate reductase (NADPH)